MMIFRTKSDYELFCLVALVFSFPRTNDFLLSVQEVFMIRMIQISGIMHPLLLVFITFTSKINNCHVYAMYAYSTYIMPSQHYI